MRKILLTAVYLLALLFVWGVFISLGSNSILNVVVLVPVFVKVAWLSIAAVKVRWRAWALGTAAALAILIFGSWIAVNLMVLLDLGLSGALLLNAAIYVGATTASLAVAKSQLAPAGAVPAQELVAGRPL